MRSRSTMATAIAAMALIVAASASLLEKAAAPPLRRRLNRAGCYRDLGDMGEALRALRGGNADRTEMTPDPEEPKVMVSFTVECQSTSVHESIGIVGACTELGSWKDIVVMSPLEWPKWTLEVPMHERYDNLEYKYVKVLKNGIVSEWEPAHNR